MKVVEKRDATRTLADYTADIKAGAVIVTDQGQPVAALVSLENADLETIGLSTNPEFIRLIDQSRAVVRSEGGLSPGDIRGRLE